MEVVQNGGSPVITIGFNTMVISDDWMILGYFGVPSGKRLHNYGGIHHAIDGKIHELITIFNSYV